MHAPIAMTIQMIGSSDRRSSAFIVYFLVNRAVCQANHADTLLAAGALTSKSVVISGSPLP